MKSNPVMDIHNIRMLQNSFMRLLVILALVVSAFCQQPLSDQMNEAALAGDLEKVKKLLIKEPSLLNGTAETGSPLCAAVFLMRKELIAFLLSKGADIEATIHQYDTPKGSKDGMPMLLSRTPLYTAAYQGYADIVKILLEAKANPSAASEDGTSILHAAVTEDNSDIVELLIQAKANVNALDKDGATPLHYSAKSADAAAAAVIAGGADIDVIAKTGPYAGESPLAMNPRIAFLASLAPKWAKSDADFPQHLVDHALMLKHLSVALREFSATHKVYPNTETATVLEKSFQGAVTFQVTTAEDFIKQLALTTKFGAGVGARVNSANNGVSQPWKCVYIPGGSGHSSPDRPVALLPLLHGEQAFDQVMHKKKALVLFADGSVRHFPIGENGKVLYNGLDIFDPKQPFWEGKSPVIYWPKK